MGEAVVASRPAPVSPPTFVANAEGFQVTTAIAIPPPVPEAVSAIATRDNAPSPLSLVANAANADGTLKARLRSLSSGMEPVATSSEIIPARRTIVFLLDKSGSMYETVGGVRRVDLAQQELRKMIQQLDTRTRFNIILYAEKVVSFQPEAVPTSPETKMLALRFLQNDSSCGGSTDFPAGYQAALGQKADTILLFTDGEFNVQDQPLLTQARSLRLKYNAHSQLNVLGFFVRPDTHAGKILARLCSDSHGELQFWKFNSNRFAMLP